MKKELDTTFLNLLKDRLIKVDPFRVILFGSYAEGTATEESDIDLAVILNKNSKPSSFREKMNYSLKVKDAVKGIDDTIIIPAIKYFTSYAA
jgi:predicted nucleotidyltransferase